MKTLHYAMMTVMLTAVLAVAVGAMYPWTPAAGAQQGEAADPRAHIDKVAERLELTDAQRETLEKPFHEVFAAMQELHRLHDVIAAELTDGQMAKLALMIHEGLGELVSNQQHGQRHHGHH